MNYEKMTQRCESQRRYNKMKKTMLIITLILVAAILSGCARTVVEEKPKQTSIFVQVENGVRFSVVYDKETKVMYAVSYYGAGSGVFTLLVNADGSPKLWKEEKE